MNQTDKLKADFLTWRSSRCSALREDLLRRVTRRDSGTLRPILGQSYKTMAGDTLKVETRIAYLSPATESGVNKCHASTPACAAACLGHSSGQLVFATSKHARICKAIWHTIDPIGFADRLDREISALVRRTSKDGTTPAVRVDGSSEIWAETLKCSDGLRLVDKHPSVEFYDYGKANPKTRRRMARNQHLTFSVSDLPASLQVAKSYLRNGGNAAIVLRTPEDVQAAIATGIDGFPVIDGDLTDARFKDAPGHFVALYSKGAAKTDDTGFVWNVTQGVAHQ